MGKKHSNGQKSGRRLPDSLTSGVRSRPVDLQALAEAVEEAESAQAASLQGQKDRTPMPPGFMLQGRIDQVAVELNLLTHDWRKNWRSMERSGRITFLAALATVISVFLPWVSKPGLPYGPGILCGGGVHLALSIFAMYLLTSRKRLLRRMNRRGRLNRSLRLWLRRIAMWHIFLGGASTLTSILFLLYYGYLKRQLPVGAVAIHWGFYVSLFFGAGLAFGGWSHFSRFPQES